MRTIIDQPIAVSAGAAQDAFVAPGFYASLGALANISAPEVRSLDRDGDHVHLVLAYRFAGTISGPARRILDPAKIAWRQEAEVDLSARRTQVRMVPENYAQLLSFSGWYQLDEDGPQRCTQHFEADLRVNVPLVGAVAERAIASGVRENLAATARLVEEYAGAGS